MYQPSRRTECTRLWVRVVSYTPVERKRRILKKTLMTTKVFWPVLPSRNKTSPVSSTGSSRYRQHHHAWSAGIWRQSCVRHPKDGLSSPEHRAEALQVLKQCFKVQLSLTIHQQTLKPLMLLTLTIQGTRPVLDRSWYCQYQEQLDEDDLDEDFYSKYPAFAKKIWSETNYPAFAVSRILHW
jgi:acyl transferase domain-containing protein